MEKAIEKFDNSEIDIIDKLTVIGIARKEASVMLALIRKPNISVKDISEITDLRQPEISLNCKSLLKKKWITASLEGSEGKGRSHYIYTFVYDIDELIEIYRSNLMNTIDEIKKDIWKG